MKTKLRILILLVLILVIIIYNIVLFIIRNNNGVSFWLSYVFINLALTQVLISGYYAVNSDNMRLIKIPCLYLLIEFIVGTVYMFFHKAGFMVVFFPQLILLALFSYVYITQLIKYR